MRQALWISAAACVLLTACPGGKYGDLADAPADELKSAQALWKDYVDALGNKKLDKRPERLAGFFSGPLVASLEPDEFAKQLTSARRKRSSGLFAKAKITALKKSPDGMLLVIDSKAGEIGIPLAEQDGTLKFAALGAAAGDWSREAVRGPVSMPAKASLLYIKMMISDQEAPVGDRLRAAVSLAEKKFRKEIIQAQKTISDPVVRLGLGLARVKIDGTDDSFIRGFPTGKAGLAALAGADKAIFEEMLEKMTNMGARIEDPPANEILYKAVAGAPPELQERLAKALYDMAEQNPRRFANAVFNITKDMDKEPALAAYFAEVQRRGGKAPKVQRFLKKFARQGEGPERALCKGLMDQFRKNR